MEPAQIDCGGLWAAYVLCGVPVDDTASVAQNGSMVLCAIHDERCRRSVGRNSRRWQRFRGNEAGECIIGGQEAKTEM